MLDKSKLSSSLLSLVTVLLICLIGEVGTIPSTPAHYLESRVYDKNSLNLLLKSLVSAHPDGMITAGPSSYRSPKEESPVVSNLKKEIEKAQNLLKPKDNTSTAETEDQETLTQLCEELIAKKSQQYQSESSQPKQESDPKDQNAAMEKLQEQLQQVYDHSKELELQLKLALQKEPQEVLHRESTKRNFEPAEVNVPPQNNKKLLYKNDIESDTFNPSTQQKRKEMMPQEPSLPPNGDYYYVDMSASDQPSDSPQRLLSYPQTEPDDEQTSCSYYENDMFTQSSMCYPYSNYYEASSSEPNEIEILCVDPCLEVPQDNTYHSLDDTSSRWYCFNWPCFFNYCDCKIIPVARVSYYFFTSSKSRDIYGTGAVFYQGEINQKIYKNIYMWVDGGYMIKKGESLGGHCGTTMRISPASIGAKYLCCLNDCFKTYAGLGVRYFFVTIHDHSDFVHRHINEHGVGVVVTAGAFYHLCNCIQFNPFFEYSYKHLSFDPSSKDKKRNISGSGTPFSGVSLGAGLGYSF